MSDAVTTCAVGATAGAAVMPVLCSLGLDPGIMVAALIGCTIAQLLLPARRSGVKQIAAWAIGSVLFSAIVTPVAVPWVLRQCAEYVAWAPTPAVRVLVAANLGAFAQPIVSTISSVMLRTLRTRVGAKEASDARDA